MMEPISKFSAIRKKGFIFNIPMIFISSFYVLICVIFYSSFIIVFSRFLKMPWVYFQISGWLIWLFWLTKTFDALANWMIQKFTGFRYKLIIFLLIIPGVSFFVTMMCIPFVFGIWNNYDFNSNKILLLIGIGFTLLGAIIILISFNTIGLESAAFYYDYAENKPFLIKNSIYGIIRHPLFVGSLIGSFGCSLLFSGSYLLLFSVINLCIAPLYKSLEERRLIKIYGEDYLNYTREVDAFIPISRLKRDLKFK